MAPTHQHVTIFAELWAHRATVTNTAMVIVTTTLAIFTGGLWLATYRLARDAKRTSDRQSREMCQSLEIADKAAMAAEDSNRVTREAFIASERPWISVEAAINSDLFRVDHGIDFGVLFTLTNHGRSPAVNVHVLYKVVTLKGPQLSQFDSIRQELELMASHDGFGKSMGIQIFPTGMATIAWKSPLTNAEIEASREFYEPAEGYLPAFYLVGSAFYQSPFSDDWYQTGFSYYVMDIGDPPEPKGSDLPDFTGVLSQFRLVLRSESFNKGTIT